MKFKVGEKDYSVVAPTQQQIADADLVYKSNYSEAVRFGALTHSEAMRIIKERKIWTIKDEEKAMEIIKDITKLGNNKMAELVHDNQYTKDCYKTNCCKH